MNTTFKGDCYSIWKMLLRTFWENLTAAIPGLVRGCQLGPCRGCHLDWGRPSSSIAPDNFLFRIWRLEEKALARSNFKRQCQCHGKATVCDEFCFRLKQSIDIYGGRAFTINKFRCDRKEKIKINLTTLSVSFSGIVIKNNSLKQ